MHNSENGVHKMVPKKKVTQYTILPCLSFLVHQSCCLTAKERHLLCYQLQQLLQAVCLYAEVEWSLQYIQHKKVHLYRIIITKVTSTQDTTGVNDKHRNYEWQVLYR